MFSFVLSIARTSYYCPIELYSLIGKLPKPVLDTWLEFLSRVQEVPGSIPYGDTSYFPHRIYFTGKEYNLVSGQC